MDDRTRRKLEVAGRKAMTESFPVEKSRRIALEIQMHWENECGLESAIEPLAPCITIQKNGIVVDTDAIENWPKVTELIDTIYNITNER